jgi:hypothetical protein
MSRQAGEHNLLKRCDSCIASLHTWGMSFTSSCFLVADLWLGCMEIRGWFNNHGNLICLLNVFRESTSRDV